MPSVNNTTISNISNIFYLQMISVIHVNFRRIKRVECRQELIVRGPALVGFRRRCPKRFVCPPLIIPYERLVLILILEIHWNI